MSWRVYLVALSFYGWGQHQLALLSNSRVKLTLSLKLPLGLRFPSERPSIPASREFICSSFHEEGVQQAHQRLLWQVRCTSPWVGVSARILGPTCVHIPWMLMWRISRYFLARPLYASAAWAARVRRRLAPPWNHQAGLLALGSCSLPVCFLHTTYRRF